MKSFIYALQGIRVAWLEQAHMRFHFVAMVVVISAGVYFSISTLEWTAITICMTMVLTAEMFNTALEYFVNLVSPQQNPLAGKIKDVAAGAVLITAVGSVVIGVLIFWPYIFVA